MSIKDTGAYIRRRLNAVGGDGAMFDDAALQAIHARAGGVPRKINSLCDLCLVAAHGAGVLGVDRALADAVIARTRYASGADAGARPMSHLSELREAGAARAGRGGVAAELAHLPFICLGPDDFIFADVAMAPLGSPGAALGLAGMPGRARRGSRKPPAARPAAGGGAVTAPLRRLSSDKRGSGRARSPSPGDLADGRPAAGAVQPPSARRQRTLRMLAVVAGGAVAAAALGVVLATAPGVDGLRLGFAPLSGLVATTPAADGATPELLPDGFGPAAAVPPAGESEAAQLGAAPVAVAALAPDDPGGADRLFRHGLDVSAEDPSAAAVDFARAAIRGHARAAYYLGQMYETGDGVPYDLALARAWYEKAGGLVWAQRRLAELPEAAGQGAAPLPLFAVRAETGETELVWSGSPADDPAGYVVELSASPEEGPVVTRPVAASAVRLAPPPKAITWWRVAPAAPGAAAVASEWQRIAAVE
jgi:hypothetical protein